MQNNDGIQKETTPEQTISTSHPMWRDTQKVEEDPRKRRGLTLQDDYKKLKESRNSVGDNGTGSGFTETQRKLNN